jgi:hypothetical protein
MRRAAASAALALLAACARPPAGPEPERDYQRVGALEISALVERDLADVLGSVDLMNTGRDTVRLEYAGQCAVAILLYEAGDGATPRWDSSAWWSAQGDCPATPMTLDLPPRTLARVVAPLVQANRILGDSLPQASYRAALRLRLLQPRDTTLLLPAGDVHLAGAGAPSLAARGRPSYE